VFIHRLRLLCLAKTFKKFYPSPAIMAGQECDSKRFCANPQSATTYRPALGGKRATWQFSRSTPFFKNWDAARNSREGAP
jgi:hypothetical protein